MTLLLRPSCTNPLPNQLLHTIPSRTYRTPVRQIPGQKKKLRAKLQALKNPGETSPNQSVRIVVPREVDETLTPVTYPYFVYRTPSLNLPVYTDIRNGGTRPETIIRKVEGDVNAFHQELIADLEQNTNEKVISRRSKSNIITLKGFHTIFVKKWLTEKGF